MRLKQPFNPDQVTDDPTTTKGSENQTYHNYRFSGIFNICEKQSIDPEKNQNQRTIRFNANRQARRDP